LVVEVLLPAELLVQLFLWFKHLNLDLRQ
jgi:hypothetical protein